MRSSDWSSDVCSSDLENRQRRIAADRRKSTLALGSISGVQASKDCTRDKARWGVVCCAWGIATECTGTRNRRQQDRHPLPPADLIPLQQSTPVQTAIGSSSRRLAFTCLEALPAVSARSSASATHFQSRSGHASATLTY